MTGSNRVTLRIGYMPLCDCATLAVAQEMGFFSEEKLDVRLEPQSSWATSRDLLRVGALDAAHMLAPAPVAAALSGDPSIVTPMALSLNGNTIVVSRSLFEQMEAAGPAMGQSCLAAAKALGAVARSRPDRPLRFAAVFSESNHNLDLRRWLKAGGLTPERDVRMAIVPPSEVERCLERGLIDAFCVGEPYGSLAVWRGAGRIVASSHDLWSNRIEKVLSANVGLVQDRPETLRALLRALLAAAQWVDRSENRLAAAALLVDAGYIRAPIEAVRSGLAGEVSFGREAKPRSNTDFLVFHRYAANFPWLSQAQWFADALHEAGLAPQPKSGQPLSFRPDLYVQAAGDLGVAYPLIESKMEAAHPTAWTLDEATQPIQMGAETRFEIPERPQS